MKLMQTIRAYDISLFLWVNQRKSQRILVRCARMISMSGDGYLYVALAIGLSMSSQLEDALFLYSLVFGFLIERTFYFAIKNVCRRERPPTALKIPSFIIPADRFSFPSGHTSAAFFVATLVGFFYPICDLIMIPWAILIGMSRVILGVHFPTDTLIGAIMGNLLALLSLEIVLK